jgi:hypothetical protein
MTTHLLPSMLAQALLSILVVYLALFFVAEGFVGMVDLSKVLGCFLLFLLCASDLVCAASSNKQCKQLEHTCGVRYVTPELQLPGLLRLLAVLPFLPAAVEEKCCTPTWMVFQRQLAVCSLYLAVCGMLWNTEQVVKVPAGDCAG